MKKFLLFMLATMICISLLSGCDNNSGSQSTNTPDDSQSTNISHSGYDTGFTMLLYNWSYGRDNKTISCCALGYSILDCLSELKETGEVVAEISPKSIDEFEDDLPIQRGTFWIQCGSRLYRLNPDMTEICKVETHLGEGKVLEMTDTLKELLYQAWYYHPYDCWSGSYENGAVTLQQIYSGDSAVELLGIEDIYIENKKGENNKIVLNLRANESKTVEAWLSSYQSGDVLGSHERKEIELESGKETALEFQFFGFYDHTYQVTIMIDNTRINLTIDPRM